MTLANASTFLGEIKEAVYAVAYRAFILSEIAYEDLFVLLDLAVLEIEKNMKNPKAAVN